MCHFRVSVDVSNQAEEMEACRRLNTLTNNGAVIKTPAEVKGKSVIVFVDHPSLPASACSVAGWVKDKFGFHPTLLPCVRLI